MSIFLLLGAISTWIGVSLVIFCVFYGIVYSRVDAPWASTPDMVTRYIFGEHRDPAEMSWCGLVACILPCAAFAPLLILIDSVRLVLRRS